MISAVSGHDTFLLRRYGNVTRACLCQLQRHLHVLTRHCLQVDEYMYDLTVDNIHEIFKRYGDVKKIAIFQKNNQWQALVQYPDHQVGIPPPPVSGRPTM